jgi:hypothetical protein
MNVHLWGAHAPPRAGDDALVIANFFSSEGGYGVKRKHSFGEGAAAMDAKQRPGFPTSTFSTANPSCGGRGACAPQKTIAASCCLTK